MRAGVTVALLVAVSGAWVFDEVGPRILAQSSVGIAIRALEGAPPELRATLLAHRTDLGLTWLHLDRIGAQVPGRFLPVRPLEDETELAATNDPRRPAADLFLWSPGLEATEHVADALCRRWPETALYTMMDRAHLSRVFAGRPAGEGFAPALPPEQWSVQGCPGRSTSP